MKKIIAFMLMIVLGLQVIVFAAPRDEQLTDLKKYSIMVGDEDGNMRLEASITRAEATKMVCTVLGIGADTFANNVEPSKFSDVPDSHWAKNYINAMKEYGAVYFGAIGGAGALLSQSVVKSEIIAYEDLGAEALRRLEVKDMPLTVVIDCYGENLYQTGVAEYLKQRDGE